MSTSSSYWQLKAQATSWRVLAPIGFWINSLAQPRPPNYSFVRSFTTGSYGISGPKGTVTLYFYHPKNFSPKSKRYPAVVNFHGGGFTIGSATDDKRWAGVVLEESQAVFVDVEYRLAPEYPFPTAVEDGCEAILHLAANSEEYGIDPSRIALSGFSAGANLVFTVPLLLDDYRLKAAEGSIRLQPWPSYQIVSLISFYPVLDWRPSRASKRAICKRPEKSLPAVLTSLFDAAYMPDASKKSSPFASPLAAPNDVLTRALPAANTVVYCCEWDMLLAEGMTFAQRLQELGKGVEYETIPEVVHGWDKLPNPRGENSKAIDFYQKACVVLNRALGESIELPSTDSKPPSEK
ncbi:MAG: hypothetical protein Q9174_005278 [Haloplaca sp. 1 TL-2023]